MLIATIGSGHPLNIDGIGGGNAVTTKVAMLSKSEDDWADVDYFFAQVSVEDQIVDFKPTCGNILSGVASAALEMGLVGAQNGETEVRMAEGDLMVIAEMTIPTAQKKGQISGWLREETADRPQGRTDIRVRSQLA